MPTPLIQLRQFMIDAYNLEELRTLCFELGFDYDELTEGGKSAKIQELLLCLGRQRKYDVLLSNLQQRHTHQFEEAGLTTQPDLLQTLYTQFNSISQLAPRSAIVRSLESRDFGEQCKSCGEVVIKSQLIDIDKDDNWVFIAQCPHCGQSEIVNTIHLGPRASVLFQGFIQKYGLTAATIEETTPLIILLWGPKEPQPTPRRLDNDKSQLRIYSIRRDLLGYLSRLGYLVFMPKNAPEGVIKDEVIDSRFSQQELSQAQAADCIVVLDDNIAESEHLLPDVPSVLRKMLVFSRQGTAQLIQSETGRYLEGRLIFLNEEELTSTALLLKVERWLKRLRFAKYYETLHHSSRILFKNPNLYPIEFVGQDSSRQDAVVDVIPLFLAYLIRNTGPLSQTELETELHSSDIDINAQLRTLERYEFIRVRNDTYWISPEGQELLTDIGLSLGQTDLREIDLEIQRVHENIDRAKEACQHYRDEIAKGEEEIQEIKLEREFHKDEIRRYARESQELYWSGQKQMAHQYRLEKEYHQEKRETLYELVRQRGQEIESIKQQDYETQLRIRSMKARIQLLQKYRKQMVAAIRKFRR